MRPADREQLVRLWVSRPIISSEEPRLDHVDHIVWCPLCSGDVRFKADHALTDAEVAVLFDEHVDRHHQALTAIGVCDVPRPKLELD